jgi:NAD(P)-dependent dehydrogenase (short-subunit alcohol dehydrogenase family)
VIALDVCVDEPGGGFALSSWDDLMQTVSEVENCGSRGYAAKADVRDRDALGAVLEETSAEFPHLDVIVANAAIARYAKFLDLDPQAWNATMAVNLTGVFNTVQLFAPRMVAAGRGGSIILTGSIAGVKGLPFCGAYAAAKHGVHGLMQVLALELGEHSIRVNTVDPGPVDTAMATDPSGPLAMSGADSLDGKLFLASFAPVLPLPESGVMSTEAISDAVAWLASDESRFVTGISVPIDAGILVR